MGGKEIYINVEMMVLLFVKFSHFFLNHIQKLLKKQNSLTNKSLLYAKHRENEMLIFHSKS